MSSVKQLKNELPTYISTIKSKHSENSKAVYFSSFITKIFGVEPAEIDMEVPTKSYFLGLRGRIDALFGKLILEFKKDLRPNLDEAKKELKKYFQSYHEKFPGEDYIGIANDGILFKVYRPEFEFSKTHEKIAVIDLEEIDSLDLDKEKDPQKIYLWFDSYLFSSDKITPTSMDIKRRFGVLSPTYATFRYEILKLYEEIEDSPSVNTKFKNWSKYLEVVYGGKEKELDLFLRHTYLSTLVKLIVHIRLSGGRIPEQKAMMEILHGHLFHGYGIHNFVEEDFFTWITYYPTRYISDPIIFKLLKELLVYDLEKIDEDVLKELYQELVEPEYRQLLGEFYTPDWLAQITIEELMPKKFERSILDPACGSGTFLFTAIRHKIKNLEKKYSKAELLDHIISTVRGFDIHPLAVTIAKTNYLLALKDLVNYKKHPIEIPVYLCDSVKLPSQKASLFDEKPVFEFEADEKNAFKLPVEMIKNPHDIDDVLEKMSNHSQPYSNSYDSLRNSSTELKNKLLTTTKENLLQGFKNSIKNLTSKNLKNVWLENYQTLIRLIDKERDSIWTFIIKNGYKPVSLTNTKVDIIAGNPPWITMSKMKNEHYQKFLKDKTKEFVLADPKKTHQVTHMELATLFFCIVVHLYLKDGGKIGFVMPKSILVSSHHKKFMQFEKPKFALEKIIENEGVFPLFKVPCCVIIGTKGGKTTFPVSCLEIEGKLMRKNADLDEAKKSLTFKETEYRPASLDVKPSDYYDEFYQGATIVPRNFYFVQLVKDHMLGINPDAPTVKSNERNVTKPPWDKITIQNQIESNFLFGTLLGDDIVPFGNRGFHLTVLPVLIENKKLEMVSSFTDFQQKNFPYASNYFEEAERKWTKNATDKSKRMTTYQRLNFRKGITNQDPKKKFKVLYVSSSTYLASCIVDTTKKIQHLENGFELTLRGFIAESKTYYFETDNEQEAHYLSAILNSKTIDNIIKPLQTRGLWGARDIHKRPLMTPIPKFSKSNSKHVELGTLGKKCSKKLPSILKDMKIKKIGTLRSAVRERLNERN